jgi:gliding motility-associated lipoprotein GldD
MLRNFSFVIRFNDLVSVDKPIEILKFVSRNLKSNLYFCKMFKNAFFIFAALFLISCGKDPVPKPYGELRLEYPAPKYQKFENNCSYTFEYSDFAKITDAKKPCWYYLNYPKMKAKLFVTYYPIQNDFADHIREAEKMVYEHTIKASAIDTKSFEYPAKKVYGNFYELKGQSASNLQFYITDSTKHFVTAYLYFNTRPKPDSLAPAVDYIKKDMKHLLDTFEWKN